MYIISNELIPVYENNGEHAVKPVICMNFLKLAKIIQTGSRIASENSGFSRGRTDSEI